MSDLISREEAIKALKETYPTVWTESDYELGQRNQWSSDELAILTVPSAEPWDVVKTTLKELEQKVEKLHADYRDTTARLKAINKIAESDQTPNRKIDGIKPLAEMEVGE